MIHPDNRRLPKKYRFTKIDAPSLPSILDRVAAFGILGNIDLQIYRNEVTNCFMKFILIVTIAATAMVFSSCNTIIGVGRDMRMGGEGLEKTATKVSGGGSGASSEDTSGAPVY